MLIILFLFTFSILLFILFLFVRNDGKRSPLNLEVGLDACMANLMRPGMYNAYHHITIIPNSEQVPGLPDRNAEMADNSKDLITKTGVYDVVGGGLHAFSACWFQGSRCFKKSLEIPVRSKNIILHCMILHSMT